MIRRGPGGNVIATLQGGGGLPKDDGSIESRQPDG
jgi:hypothetical protein